MEAGRLAAQHPGEVPCVVVTAADMTDGERQGLSLAVLLSLGRDHPELPRPGPADVLRDPSKFPEAARPGRKHAYPAARNPGWGQAVNGPPGVADAEKAMADARANLDVAAGSDDPAVQRGRYRAASPLGYAARVLDGLAAPPPSAEGISLRFTPSS